MGNAAFLLWINRQKLEHEGKRDATVDFAAIYAGIIVLEELWRAGYEAYGQHTLIVTAAIGNAKKCELAILHEANGNLLDVAKMRHVFGDTCDEKGFFPSVAACRVLRDRVLHSAWAAIPAPYSRYSHLLMKVLFTLCGAVDIRPG